MPERPLAVVRPWRWWGGFCLAAGAATCLTVLAYREGLPPALERIWQFDKVIHFSLAGLLAFFLDGALRHRDLLVINRKAIPLAAIGVLAPAGFDELMQSFSPVRSASLWDFAADVAGVLVCIPLSRRLSKSG